jgi:hypothetical protein
MVCLNNDWLDNPRLDLSDRHEIEVLCAALNCEPVDVFLAVGMVGDSVRDIRRYIGKVLEKRLSERAATTLSDIPPVWRS